jgi:hypothetical protein
LTALLFGYSSPNRVSIHLSITHYSTQVLAEKKDFKQLEDFNSKTEADDAYQRQYFEHLSDPEKAKCRAEVRARKQRQAAEAGEQQPAALNKDQIKDLNKKWQDSEVTS